LQALLLISGPQQALTATLPVFIAAVLVAVVSHLLWPRYGGGIKPFLQRSWLLGSVAGLSFLSTIYCGKLAQEPGVSLEADMQISGGQVVGLYVNDLTAQPKRASILSNSRRIYRFERLPGNIEFLRIDPANASSTQISIYSVAIMSNGHLVRRISPSELKAWKLYNLTEVTGDAASFNLLTAPDASRQGDYLAADVSVFASERATWVTDLADVVQGINYYSLVFILCFLLFLLCGVSTVHGAIEAGLITAIALIAYPVAVLISKIPARPPPVTSAVGLASYIGYPKFNGYLISFALLILSVGLAWLASRYLPSKTPHLQDEGETASKRTHGWISRLVPPVILLWLLILFCPNLAALLPTLPTASYSPTNWDTQSSIFWDYLIQSGYLPYRDFWFPYSGFYTHSLPFPNGHLLGGIQAALTLWFLYLGLQFALERRRRTAALIFAMVFLPAWLGEFWGWYRYLLSIDVVLFYVALQNTHRFEWRKHVPFAFLAAFAFFYEPTQLAYAGAGMLAHTLFAMWPKLDERHTPKAMLVTVLAVVRQRLVYIGLPLLAGVVAALAFFAAKGILPGFIRQQLSAPVQAVYGSYPADVVSWTKPILQIETMFMVLFFALALGFHAWFRNREHRDITTLVLLVTGLAGFVVMQKHITRPPIIEEAQIFPYICVLMYVLGMWRRRTPAQSAVVALYLGFVIGVLEYRGLVSPLYRTVIHAPALVAGNLDVMFHRSREVRVVNAARYDRSRFDGFVVENRVVDTLRNEFGWNSQQTVYVLGDDVVFYMLMRQKPPYVLSTYNGSPLEEQQRVVQWHEERKPRFVIWNPMKDSFDTVPHTVRLPLIFRYVVENYRPVKTVEQYQILIAKQEPAAGDGAFWRQYLGTRLDMGHIPRLTKASGYRDCPGENPSSCEPVLYVRFPSRPAPGKVVLTVDSPSGPFEVAFDVVAGTRECIIDLNRLWFRSLIGIVPRVTLSVAGAEIHHEFRVRKSDVLY
jgi:hypothetical protein